MNFIKKILSEEYMQEKADQLLNNQKVKTYLKENNKEYIIDMEEDESAGVLEDKSYILMMNLGIPIGVRTYYDPNGKEVLDEDDFDLDKDYSNYKWVYTPINSLEDLRKYAETHYELDFTANHNLITPKQERHIAYLLEFANDNRFFNQYTMNKMQNELIDNAPLTYDKAMSILKKYYTRDVCSKFINDYGVEKERFYYLSGIDYDSLTKKRFDRGER